MIEPLPAYEFDQRVLVSAIPGRTFLPVKVLDRHRRTRARAPDADPRVATNPPGPVLPPRRGTVSHRKITGQRVRRNIADPPDR
jgi:hypothetical protein